MKKTTIAIVIALLATGAMANGVPEPKAEKPEPAKASAATSIDTCTTPTSVAPSPDAKTWPCKNFSK